MAFRKRRESAEGSARKNASKSRKSKASAASSSADADRVLRDIDRNRKKEERERKRALQRYTDRKRAKTVQGYIGYEQMIEDGVCWIDNNLWSKTIRFSDINYQIARRDDQIDIFGFPGICASTGSGRCVLRIWTGTDI